MWGWEAVRNPGWVLVPVPDPDPQGCIRKVNFSSSSLIEKRPGKRPTPEVEPYNEWLTRVGELDAALTALAEDARYPAGPDRERIEAFSVAAHRRAWGW